VICPRCANPFLQRVRPDGLLGRLLALLFVHPFRCQICRHRFHAVRWGIRYDREPEDRRQCVRRAVRFSATLASPFGEHAGSVTELSIGGCSIAVFTPYRVGDTLSIRLCTQDDQPPIEVSTAVIRTVSQGRLGVEFLTFRDHEEARLRQLMLTLWIEGEPAAREKHWEKTLAAIGAAGNDHTNTDS